MTVAIDAQHLGDWTGSIFGTRSRDDRASEPMADRTMLDDSLLGPGLRELLPLWDEALTPTTSKALLDMGSVVIRVAGADATPHIRFLLAQPAAKPASQRAVQQLEGIRELLNLPMRDVCKAAGIPTRTYYAWRKRHAALRLGATNRLADLRATVDDLHEMLGDDLQLWIRQARQVDLLRKGRFDVLLREALTWRSRTHPIEDVSSWGHATSVDWPETEATPVLVSRQRSQASTRVATVRRSSEARED